MTKAIVAVVGDRGLSSTITFKLTTVPRIGESVRLRGGNGVGAGYRVVDVEWDLESGNCRVFVEPHGEQR